MRAGTKAWPAMLVVLGVLAVSAVAGGVGLAATAKPDFGLGVSPASQSVQQGQQAKYTVTATGSGGFTGSVAYSVSGLPSGASGTFSPTSTSLSASVRSGSSSLTVVTGKTTSTGIYSLKITGTSGNTKRSVSAKLTVTYALTGSFRISAAPSTVTVAPGSTAVYTVTVARTGSFTGAVTLAPYGSWPSGVSPTFSPNPVPRSGTSSTLQVSTTVAVATGTYTLYLVGSSKDTTSGQRTYQYAQVQLAVQTSGKPFTISGGSPAGSLAPGVGNQPLNLALGNPNNQAISVTNLSVTVSGTSVTACGPGNFQVTQYSGLYPLSVPAGASNATLTSLGVPSAQLPQLKMLDLSTNQDACKGVTVNLSYSGSAQGN